MDCMKFNEHAQELMDGRADAALAEALLAHSWDCAECAATLEDLKRVDSVLRAVPREHCPAGLAAAVVGRLDRPADKVRNTREYAWLSAACVIVGVIVGAAFGMCGGVETAGEALSGISSLGSIAGSAVSEPVVFEFDFSGVAASFSDGLQGDSSFDMVSSPGAYAALAGLALICAVCNFLVIRRFSGGNLRKVASGGSSLLL
jgi:hypothetical protein